MINYYSRRLLVQIEVVPFFHKMAFTILAQVGEDNPRAVVATTITSYAISSIITGAVFFALGTARLGSLIGFFPRHILVGCIGGVGWFLMATGIEVSAKLDGNLQYDLDTLRKLAEPHTLALWTVPLACAILLIVLQKFIKSSLFMPLYFMSIPVFFYVIVVGIAGFDLSTLRQGGWVFDAPAAGKPFYHFYTLYGKIEIHLVVDVYSNTNTDFKAVDWDAVLNTVPAMFALTFFGILHVPINVPALGVSTGEDNIDVDRELIAHGISNALSGFAGSIQNYLVYSNSILFVRAGGNSRLAGVLLAIATAGVMAAGPTVIGFIPIMVVGALIFLLGVELMKEALYDTWGKLSRFEYLTISIIVITMGAWDFVYGENHLEIDIYHWPLLTESCRYSHRSCARLRISSRPDIAKICHSSYLYRRHRAVYCSPSSSPTKIPFRRGAANLCGPAFQLHVLRYNRLTGALCP